MHCYHDTMNNESQINVDSQFDTIEPPGPMISSHPFEVWHGTVFANLILYDLNLLRRSYILIKNMSPRRHPENPDPTSQHVRMYPFTKSLCTYANLQADSYQQHTTALIWRRRQKIWYANWHAGLCKFVGAVCALRSIGRANVNERNVLLSM